MVFHSDSPHDLSRPTLVQAEPGEPRYDLTAQENAKRSSPLIQAACLKGFITSYNELEAYKYVLLVLSAAFVVTIIGHT